MTEQKDLLHKKLKSVSDQIPLNYAKAKLVFSHKMDYKEKTIVNFIKIAKYNTESAVSFAAEKPISRIL